MPLNSLEEECIKHGPPHGNPNRASRVSKLGTVAMVLGRYLAFGYLDPSVDVERLGSEHPGRISINFRRVLSHIHSSAPTKIMSIHIHIWKTVREQKHASVENLTRKIQNSSLHVESWA